MVKKRPSIAPGAHYLLLVPVFLQGPQTVLYTYKVVAVTCRYGASLGEGHYRSVLRHPRSGLCWHTDDGVAATKTSERSLRSNWQDAYIHWAVRV